MLTESQRKCLTEYVGECWHTLTAFLDNGIIECSCGARMSRGPDEATFHVEQENNRTFTTWADLGVVKEAIERKGEWGYASCGFERWAYINAYLKEFPIPSGNETFDSWLFNPSRFCSLVCAWKEVK